LEEIAGFLCIKAMQRIERNWGYDLETVLNSTFCIKLLSKSSPLALATKGTQVTALALRSAKNSRRCATSLFPLELRSLATKGTQEWELKKNLLGRDS